MDQKIIKPFVLKPWLYFFCYVVVGLFIEVLVFVLSGFGLGSLGFYIKSRTGSFPSSLNLFIIYTLLIGIAIVWLKITMKKAFAREEIIVNGQNVTIINSGKTYIFPISSITKTSLSSKLNTLSKLTAASQFFPTGITNIAKSFLAIEAYKQYFLTINYIEKGVSQNISFNLSNYRGTTAIVETFQLFSIPIERIDEDLVERVWDNPTNRMPFIIALIVLFLVTPTIAGLLYPTLNGNMDFFWFVSFGLGLIISCITFFLVKNIPPMRQSR